MTSAEIEKLLGELHSLLCKSAGLVAHMIIRRKFKSSYLEELNQSINRVQDIIGEFNERT